MHQCILCNGNDSISFYRLGTDLLKEYNCLCLQVNPIVGHLNFLLYDWKGEVNHPLIKTP
jgi:hypothetical protein